MSKEPEETVYQEQPEVEIDPAIPLKSRIAELEKRIAELETMLAEVGGVSADPRIRLRQRGFDPDQV